MNSEQPFNKDEGVAKEGWMDVAAREFIVKEIEYVLEDPPSSMAFSMKDIVGWWKSGLMIDGVKIEPKST